MATTIVLTRHGETDWNRERRFQGRVDVPLNDAGRAQARDLAAALAGEALSGVYTSPLLRAAETAEVVGATLGLEVRRHDSPTEVDVGSWSGLSEDEVEARFPEGYARWRDSRSAGWKDGETDDELATRVVVGLREIARRQLDGHVLAVTHGGPIRAALAAALGSSRDEVMARVASLHNCGMHRIAVRDGNLEAVD